MRGILPQGWTGHQVEAPVDLATAQFLHKRVALQVKARALGTLWQQGNLCSAR